VALLKVLEYEILFKNTNYHMIKILGCNGEQLERILDFVFLEPEDDPRHFCYLTVVAQKSCEAYAAPYALLYSLSYVIKEVVSEGRILYEDLQYITLRWDLNFGPLIVSQPMLSI
jgi:beta-propeller of ELYS nucleoporin